MTMVGKKVNHCNHHLCKNLFNMKMCSLAVEFERYVFSAMVVFMPRQGHVLSRLVFCAVMHGLFPTESNHL